MAGIVLRVIAVLLFVIAAFSGSLFGKSGLELVALGLAAYVAATLCDGYFGPYRRVE